MEILNFKGPLSDLIYILKKGGSIHIKKKNRGKFTEYCGGKVTEECIAKGKKSKDPKIRKRATFAANARKWKHENGGILKYQNPAESLPELKDTTNINYLAFKKTLPDNLRLTPEKDYHMYDYWRLSEEPENFTEGKQRGMFTWDKSDNGYHAGSIAEDRNTGIYYFMKPKHHPTVKYELDWFNKGLKTLEGGKQVPVKGRDKKFWEDFTSKYQLDTTGVDYRYVPIKKQGGILKAQEGTGSLLTSHPLSPVVIALNQAKAMAKMKGEQQHLPPGVKEVVGPDGKKVAIRAEQPLVPLEQSIAEWLPGTGDVAEVGYIANDLKNGNYGTAALASTLLLLPGAAGKLIKRSNIPTQKVVDLNGIKKVNITLEDPSKYWYVGHQTGSSNFDKIAKEGLQTGSGLNGTALYLTQDYMSDFANGRLKTKGMSHEGADGMIVMKFPKDKFPSGNLDDISERLMDLGESKSFEIPPEYLQFFKRDQFKQGGKL